MVRARVKADVQWRNALSKPKNKTNYFLSVNQDLNRNIILATQERKAINYGSCFNKKKVSLVEQRDSNNLILISFILERIHNLGLYRINRIAFLVVLLLIRRLVGSYRIPI